MSIISSDYLRSVRRDALRKRTWFKSLDKLERGIVNLTIDIVKNLKSQLLAVELVKILAKLRDATKNVFTKYIEKIGYRKLREAVQISLSLGNFVAKEWLRDSYYAEWFAVNNINNPVGWRI